MEDVTVNKLSRKEKNFYQAYLDLCKRHGFEFKKVYKIQKKK